MDAAASGGATMAPSAIAAGQDMSGNSVCTSTATAPVVTPTAAMTSVDIGNQLARRSRKDVSKEASSNTGATKSANASFGSSVQVGDAGTKESNAPPTARKVG